MFMSYRTLLPASRLGMELTTLWGPGAMLQPTEPPGQASPSTSLLTNQSGSILTNQDSVLWINQTARICMRTDPSGTEGRATCQPAASGSRGAFARSSPAGISPAGAEALTLSPWHRAEQRKQLAQGKATSAEQSRAEQQGAEGAHSLGRPGPHSRAVSQLSCFAQNQGAFFTLNWRFLLAWNWRQ
uniref:Uncharacterized protein n=1 Tax=Myotis myotis TaxID=51298 RepID=A0A7J7Z5U6_MYOMY|nr:hypothetical protein mMyoMyo1_010790 [Myotis myotis]